ncbi:uncharacterized protein LOC117827368 [Notolabrus celidotus]|uniref:uncharacterized protein LOC117827368 n=1 Tax=Notolabrus celidotus TaxID=1203425 RepID=UPI001490597F|nr:uncharacterized protein LOC117827368 [Notolabrus celidotus]
MYTETTGHHRFLQHFNTSIPCSCQHCVHYEKPYSHHAGLGYPPGMPRQTDHPSLDCRRDIQAPRVKDVGGRAFLVERSGHRSPQRRPVFSGQSPHSQSGDDLSQVLPWELNPAQRSYPPPEPGVRHYPSVKEQCGCVVRSDTRTHPFNTGIPHPLPHLQVKGQGYRHRRTIRYVSVDEEQEACGCTSENYHLEAHNYNVGRSCMPNGHCGPGSVFFEGGEERDSHQDRGQLRGGSEEGCNGREGSHKGFFPTEVPQKQLKQSRQKVPCFPPSSITIQDPSKSRTSDEHQQQGSEVVKQKRRQDLVRDQIRQVVTNLEDVLGGLKQVHVEMKEVVEQIDRLTASIDLNEETACITQGSSANCHGSVHPGDLKVALLPNHKPPPVQMLQHVDEDRIILRTNSPSPVHMASVVKTSRFTPPSHTKDISHERPGVNGHPPHLCPPRDSNNVGQTYPEPHPPHSLDPKVIIGNSTSNSRTQKPPLYPQNGRCGKGPYPPPKPVKTPSYPGGRGRQSASIV